MFLSLLVGRREFRSLASLFETPAETLASCCRIGVPGLLLVFCGEDPPPPRVFFGVGGFPRSFFFPGTNATASGLSEVGERDCV